MKFVNVLTFCCAVASASPVANISLADLQQGSSGVHEVDILKRDDKFQAAQNAAGRTKLKAGKSYYFLACMPFNQEVAPEKLGPAELWVRDQTRWDRSQHGCSHVGLVVGTVAKTGSKGCLTCGDNTFDAKYWDVLLYDQNQWMQRGQEWRASGRQTLYFRGEVGKQVNMAQLDRTLATTGSQWMRQAGRDFNEDFNCLTYYNALVPNL